MVKNRHFGEISPSVVALVCLLSTSPSLFRPSFLSCVARDAESRLCSLPASSSDPTEPNRPFLLPLPFFAYCGREKNVRFLKFLLDLSASINSLLFGEVIAQMF